MVRLAIIREQNIVETTVRFSISRKDQNYGWSGYNPRAKNRSSNGQIFYFKKILKLRIDWL